MTRFSLPSRPRPATFALLLALEALAAAVCTFLLPADPKNALLWGRSLSRWVLIAALLLAALLAHGAGLWLRRRPALEARVHALLERPALAPLPAAAALLLFAALLALRLSPASALRLAPLLAFFVLALLQVAGWYACPAALVEGAGRRPARWLAAFIALVLYAALAAPGLPSRPLDGLPWDRPLEYILAALVLPAALLVDWRAFARRPLAALAALALMVQILAAVLLPPAGWNVRIFTSPENAQAGAWQPGYESVVRPGRTAVMTQPYDHTRQFPLEWVNADDYDFGRRWFALDVRGAVSLQPGERLFLLVNGAQDARAQLTDVSGTPVPVEMIHDPADISPAPDSSSQQPVVLQLAGFFTFTGEADHQLVPLIARADGSTFSPFPADRTWQPATAAQPSALALGLAWLGNALTILAAFLALAGALWRRFRAGDIGTLDLLLAALALGVFWAASYFSPAQLASLVLPVILALLAVRAWFGLPAGARLERALLASVGLALVALLLRLDLGDLREIELFPQGQDNFRYQVIARYIFTSGDPLQLNRLPLIYKFLYPYLAGGLHVLFGQSPAAQFLLNGWGAVLTALAVSATLGARGVSSALRWAAAAAWLAIITGSSFFLFYFRFGLIEPLSVLLYSLAALFAIRGQRGAWLATGVTLTLLRLDYAILLISTLWLGMPDPAGTARQAAGQILRASLRRWRSLLAAGLAVSLLPVGLTLLFWLRRGVLITRAADTRHDSLASVFEGWARLFNGGTPAEVGARFAQAPLDMLLFWAVIYGGLILALLAWLRRAPTLDRRWLLLFAALLLTYALVRPTGYSPRFSTPVVVMSVLALADGVYRWQRKPHHEFHE